MVETRSYHQLTEVPTTAPRAFTIHYLLPSNRRHEFACGYALLASDTCNERRQFRLNRAEISCAFVVGAQFGSGPKYAHSPVYGNGQIKKSTLELPD